MAGLLDPGMSWAEVDWLRADLAGPLLLKGILHPAEAAEAVARGIDGIIVSNHGGRQLDGAAASLDALPGVVAAVGGPHSGAGRRRHPARRRRGQGDRAGRRLLPDGAAATLGPGGRRRGRRRRMCWKSSAARSTAPWGFSASARSPRSARTVLSLAHAGTLTSPQ